MAKSRLLRSPGLRGPDQASSQSQLPLWVLLTSSLSARPDTAKSRKTVGRGIQNDVALACEGFAVHWPLLRPDPCTLGIAPFLRTHCIDRPLETLFMFVVRFQCLSFLNNPLADCR